MKQNACKLYVFCKQTGRSTVPFKQNHNPSNPKANKNHGKVKHLLYLPC